MSGMDTWEELEEYLGVKYRDVGTKIPAAFRLKRLTGPINSQLGFPSNELLRKLPKKKRKSRTITKPHAEEVSTESINNTQSGVELSQTSDVVLSSTRIDQTSKKMDIDSITEPMLSPIPNSLRRRTNGQHANEISDVENNNSVADELHSPMEQVILEKSLELVSTAQDDQSAADKSLQDSSAVLKEAIRNAELFLDKHREDNSDVVNQDRSSANAALPLPSTKFSATTSSSFALLCQIGNRLAQWRHDLEEADQTFSTKS